MAVTVATQEENIKSLAQTLKKKKKSRFINMALLLSCLEVCVCSMWSRAVFEIRPDLCILRRFGSIHGSLKPEYQTPILPNGRSQYGHEKWPPAGVTGHS